MVVIEGGVGFGVWQWHVGLGVGVGVEQWCWHHRATTSYSPAGLR